MSSLPHIKLFKTRSIKDGTLALWWDFIRQYWRVYLAGSTFVILTNLTEVFIPKCVEWSIDLLKEGKVPSFLNHFESQPHILFYWVVIFFVFSIIIQGFCRAGWRLTLGRQTHQVASFFKSSIWQQSRNFPRLSLAKTYTPGVLMSIATSDVGVARFIFGFTLIGTIDAIFLTTLSLLAMLTINIELTLMTLCVVPIMPIIIDRLARLERKFHKIAQENLSVFNHLTSGAVSTVRLQRITGTGKFWENKLEEKADQYRKDRLKVVNTSLAFIPSWGGISIVSYVILFTFGVDKIIAKEITIGQFVALQSYVFLLAGPLGEIGYIISEWQKSYASLERIRNVLIEPLSSHCESKEPILNQPKRGDDFITVNNLTYRYPKQEREILTNFNLKLKHGKRIGIIGPIGSGKSTLLEILAGLERDFQGDVHLLGKDIRLYLHEDMRKLISLVPQKSFLFADSVRNNILLGHEASDEELWHYLQVAEIADEVRGFENGLDTELGEWGINLSGGQKQRLTLARALIRKPKLLLLDDCVSAVDTVKEENILKSLDRELKSTSLIWSAHRDSTLAYCDEIIELKL